MNKTTTRSNVVVLKQILNHIPLGLINRHARETGVDAKARTFSVVSHLATMLFAQLSHAIGLNDVCDWLRLKAAALALRRHPAIPQQSFPRQQGAQRGVRRTAVLVGAGASAARVPGLRRRTQGKGTAAALQGQDPRGGFDDDATGCQLHGLGQTP